MLAIVIPLVDTPYDFGTAGSTVSTVLGGLATGLTGVIALALTVTAVMWGVPRIVKFFKRLAG
jgi:hypothetical protein